MSQRFLSPSLRSVVLAASAVALVISGCGDGPVSPDPITALPRALTASERVVIAAGNDFATSLLKTVYENQPDSTVFLSPLSASMALGMAMNGAQGATRTQMGGTLGFASLPMEEVNASYHDLIELLRELDPSVDFRLGNALFHRDGFTMETPFLNAVRTAFDARVQGLDFDDPSSADVINGWVRDATAGRIEGIVDPPINPLTMAFLLNAVYFKGDWTEEFDEARTRDGTFHLQDGGVQDVRFMARQDEFSYRDAAGWQAVEIPYGGEAWVLTVAVPRSGYGLDAVVSDAASILDPTATWGEVKLMVEIPRFQLEWERVLNDDLRALGMVDALSPELADFSAMMRNAREAQLHIQRVKQKTFLKIDEKGTEAAAVTSVEVGVTSAPPSLRADRPFLLAIRERLSGTVLFAGLIIQAPEDR